MVLSLLSFHLLSYFFFSPLIPSCAVSVCTISFPFSLPFVFLSTPLRTKPHPITVSKNVNPSLSIANLFCFPDEYAVYPLLLFPTFYPLFLPPAKRFSLPRFCVRRRQGGLRNTLVSISSTVFRRRKNSTGSKEKPAEGEDMPVKKTVRSDMRTVRTWEVRQ